MRNNRPPADFDLPTKHLAKEKPYIPPKTRDPAERERLHGLPHGTLMAERQQSGLVVATKVLEFLAENSNGLRFATKWLAASGLNTGWYSFAADSDVMRRRLKLPRLATEDPEQRPSALMIYRNILDGMKEAQTKAGQVVNDMGKEKVLETHQAQLGRVVGNAALAMSCFAIGDFVGYESSHLNDYDLQHMARSRGLASLEDARSLATIIGTAPSMAQLADPDSDLSVFWRREAPQDAFEALDFATAA